ncbi:MAG TPA: 50S ribosomal protein L23 [Candidatus Paceibacterota bacterium]
MEKFLVKNPIISEKATKMSALGKYIFLVDKKATKPEIKKIIKVVYKVDPVFVHIVNIKPKVRRLGRTSGVKPGYKKAIVTLKAGQKLDVLPH